MPIPMVIDALRQLAPLCPGSEAALLQAAEHLSEMVRALAAPPTRQTAEWILPPPLPMR